MSVIKDILSSGETLFSNADALDPEFVPKLLPHRENQQHYIALAIKPLFLERSGKNLLIRGEPGIGKTAATKRVLMDLDEAEGAENIPVIFTNCWTQNTTFKALTHICHSLGYKFTHNLNTTEIIEKIKQLVKAKQGVVFAFDEIDKAEDYDFLYFILEEIPRKTILAITNDYSWGEDLDPRIKSRLSPEVLEFPAYTAKETEDILRERIKYSFYQGVWDELAFQKIAARASQYQDVRVGILLLKKAGEQAEASASKKVLQEHAEKAIQQTDVFKIKTSAELTEDEKLALEICKENDKKIFGELYEAYQKKGGQKSERTFKRLLDKLENRKLIKQEIADNLQGRSSRITYIGFEKKLSDFNLTQQ